MDINEQGEHVQRQENVKGEGWRLGAQGDWDTVDREAFSAVRRNLNFLPSSEGAWG